MLKCQHSYGLFLPMNCRIWAKRSKNSSTHNKLMITLIRITLLVFIYNQYPVISIYIGFTEHFTNTHKIQIKFLICSSGVLK